MFRKHQVLVVALFVSLAASTAKADLLVSAEFQGSEGTGVNNFPTYQGGDDVLASAADSVFSSSGNTWNALKVAQYDAGTTANPSWSGLKDRGTGTATSVGFSITGNVYAWNNNGVGGYFGSPINSDQFFFGVVGASTTFDWSITGLTAGARYKLFLYGSDVPGRGLSQTIDTDGNQSLTNNTAVIVGAVASTGTEFVAVANSLGSIVGHAEVPSTNAGEGDWSGFQIAQVSVPEPSTLALCCAGLMSLLAYAWRKRK